MLKSLSLQDHRLLVLSQELLRKTPENPNRQKQIPRRHKINPAKTAEHRGDRGPTGKPQLPAPDLLGPDIGQNKVDGGSHRLPRIFPQHAVRRAVRAGRVGAHPESIRNRLKLFFLLVNTVSAAPVPRLMHKRPVRGVHQPDNSLVDMRRQIACEVRDSVFFAEDGQLRSLRNCLWQSGSLSAHVNPEISVALFARKMAGKNTLDLQFVLTSERGNL